MPDLPGFTNDFWLALLIGILVLADVYLLLELALGFPSAQARKAGGIFAGAAGILTTLYLLQSPALLHRLVQEIVLALAGLLLATIALLRRKTQ
ncbi:MAG: hypothetical protein JXA37_04180 [Chloroflexia bacterium]|nr:hypothetical protein [Chloroflexia bacterium]